MTRNKKQIIPDDPYPETEQRFERLLRTMAKPVEKIPSEEDQTSDAERVEDCDDTQTPTDTSEDAS